ncbi:hypothetical protein FOZ60_000278 [Perkinsus olseni]|uniref:RING-type domain-containing protein n=1 Tax=Perkinsus olseni TaxID=32597 RepID=A0A7J6P2Q6_PEROL|nr:hypothetical protein FOZ60_000278 [Perkinsus olseni]
MLPSLPLSPQSVFCHSCGSRSEMPEIIEAPELVICPACESTQTELSPYLPDTYITRRHSRDETDNTAASRGRLLRRPSLIESEEHQAAVIGLVRLYERGQIPDARFIELLAEFSREPDGASPLENAVAQRSTSSAGMVRYWRSDSLGLDDTPVCEALIERLDEISRVGFCTICSENIDEGDTGIELTSGCGHYFHSCCIKHWFTKRNTCPTCRHEYPTDGVEFLRSIGDHEEAYELAVQGLLQRQQALKEALEVLRYVHRELATATRRSSLTSWSTELDYFNPINNYQHSDQLSDDEQSSVSNSSSIPYRSGDSISDCESRRARSYPASPRTMNRYAVQQRQGAFRWGVSSGPTWINSHYPHSSSPEGSELTRTHRRACSTGDRLDRSRDNIMQYTVDSLSLQRLPSDDSRRKI